VIAVTIGNVLKWFDFAEVFSPAGNAAISLLVTFGAFGLSRVVRPLGAIIVQHRGTPVPA
jgi:MHS family proline/betaine transporter-like MFS transporter